MRRLRICVPVAGSSRRLRDEHWRKPFAQQPDSAGQIGEAVLIHWKNSMRTAKVVLTVALIVASGCKKKNVSPFPDSGAIAGWQKTDATRVFEAKDLWQYIDGDPEHFIQAGVISTATSDYTYNGQLEAVVDVHTMSGSDRKSVV